jgi:hypothetical protein
MLLREGVFHARCSGSAHPNRTEPIRIAVVTTAHAMAAPVALAPHKSEIDSTTVPAVAATA